MCTLSIGAGTAAGAFGSTIGGAAASGAAAGAAGGAASYLTASSLHGSALSGGGQFGWGGLGKAMVIGGVGGALGGGAGTAAGGEFLGAMTGGVSGASGSYAAGLAFGAEFSTESLLFSIGGGIAGAVAGYGVSQGFGPGRQKRAPSATVIGEINKWEARKMIVKAQRVLGQTFEARYDPELRSADGMMSLRGVWIGRSGLSSVATLKSTLGHEGDHVKQLRNRNLADPKKAAAVIMNELEAYTNELNNAEVSGLSENEIVGVKRRRTGYISDLIDLARGSDDNQAAAAKYYLGQYRERIFVLRPQDLYKGRIPGWAKE